MKKEVNVEEISTLLKRFDGFFKAVNIQRILRICKLKDNFWNIFSFMLCKEKNVKVPFSAFTN